MFTRKVDFRRCHLLRWCVLAALLSGVTVARGQFGGLSQVDSSGSEPRLYPNGLPKIEIMLKAALEHHPDVLAARSKLRSAEAEQKQAELKAFKDLIVVRDRWEKANRLVITIKASKSIDPLELGDAMTQLAAIEWELGFLLGTLNEPIAATKPAVKAGVAAPPAPGGIAGSPVVVASVIPRGEQAAMIKKQLGNIISVHFENITLKDAVAELAEKSKLRIIIDAAALEESGVPIELPITCQLGELELVTVLQALEDLQKPLSFIVRDYGILLTTESGRTSEAISARDFAKLSEEELRDKLQQQRQMNAGSGHHGGMSGGGLF